MESGIWMNASSMYVSLAQLLQKDMPDAHSKTAVWQI
jgi:hypothetical protein